jgi:hypothetical protein
MIYLFYGSDADKVRTKAFDWVAAARTKEPNLAYARLTREDLTPAALDEAAAAGGLFVSRLLIVIDDPFPTASGRADPDGADDAPAPDGCTNSIIEEYVERLAASDNAIVVLAPKLPAMRAKKLAAQAKITYRFDAAERAQSRGFNAALVNALATRSRETLWLEVARALHAGDRPEMLHGLLHWKARDLMEKGARAWSPEEARALSFGLIELLMDTRRKGLDLSRSLERFALAI